MKSNRLIWDANPLKSSKREKTLGMPPAGVPYWTPKRERKAQREALAAEMNIAERHINQDTEAMEKKDITEEIKKKLLESVSQWSDMLTNLRARFRRLKGTGS